jgi:hypothetical protein
MKLGAIMKTTHSSPASALALAALVSMGLPSISAASEPLVEPATAAAQKPIEELQQLDEIWVHGQSLAMRIAKAENAFFYRYNKINRKGDFRVSCGYFTLDRGSMVMRRNCMPSFMEPVSTSMGYLARSTGCNALMHSGDMQERGSPCTVMEIARSRTYRLDSIPIMRAVSATPAQRKQYATHVMKLILTDDELRSKAGDLAVLYKEFDETQEQYRKAKASVPPAKPKRNPRF